MFELFYTAEAKAQIQKFNIKIQGQLKTALLRLAQNSVEAGKRLTRELTGYWSFHCGDCRVIYQIYREEVRILVVTVAHWKSVYENQKPKLKS